MRNPELATLICERLAEGESLREICRSDGLPSESMVRRWALEDAAFGAQYARARDLGYEALAADILEIADNTEVGQKTVSKATGLEITESDMTDHRRLKIEARKWILSKMLPKMYGDKVTNEHTGADGGPIKTESTVNMSPEDAYKKMLDGI